MFVLHALILTFMTTPLTLLFYPSKYRARAGAPTSTEAGSVFPVKGDLHDALKSRFSVIVDRVEQLPAVMTLMQLLRSPSPQSPAPPVVDEKASLEHSVSPPSLAHDSQTTALVANRRISLDALRLIELTNRASAVLRSQEAETLVHSDTILAVLKTFGYLNGMDVSTALAVIGADDFPVHVSQHVREAASQMVILPWVSPAPPVDDGTASTTGHGEHAGTDGPSGSSDSPVSPSSSTPFDALFQQKRDRSAIGGQAHYIRRVFADAPADVALFWDRGLPQAFESDAQYHLFLPFFGGPDDRLALSFVAQLCLNPAVSATVTRMRRVGDDALSPMNSIDQAKAQHLLHSDTIHTVRDTNSKARKLGSKLIDA